MPTVTLTVKYVNPPKPGKNRGSIKDTDDVIYGVFGDKLHQFEAGKTYDIDYTEQDVNGVTYRTVKSVTPLSSGAPKSSASTPSSGGGSYRETSARDAERMFVCSILNAAIQGQQVEFNRQRVGAAVAMLRGVWQETFGQADGITLPQQREPAPPARVANGAAMNGNHRVPIRQDMRDEIPF